MGLFRKSRRPATRYVVPPELRAGVVVLAERDTWRVVAVNDASASPGQLPAAELAADLATDLAETFRRSWQQANNGAAGAPALKDWIQALRGGSEKDSADGWRDFFRAGGAVFKITARPAEGIEAQRYVWHWPLTGRDLVQPSLKTGDRIDIVEAGSWRTAIDNAPAWSATQGWARAAAWMRDRASSDPRASLWWIADEDGRPGLPVEREDVTAAVRGWWTGDWFAFGSRVIERYELAAPRTDGAWYAWLRWDPTSPRSDGLGSVLGLRRDADNVEVWWWEFVGSLQTRRAVARDPEVLSIDLVERLCAAIADSDGPPALVDWVDAETV
jgi:hypothetical protein